MIYFMTMQLMSFFQLGSFYVSIKIFFQNYFSLVTDTMSFAIRFPHMWAFFNNASALGFASVFSYLYAILLILTVLTSIAAPIEKSISYFRIITVIYSILTILTLIGISAFMAENGLFPTQKHYDKDAKKWIDDGV